ncbi:hypothetical protein [Halorubrum aethiopicum]|uniref:hypothetical protein n=1 Tax=Halorubrum aethiopicum TaxID=1758255 RepID=UPI000836CA63|nr:hypothetical protein [Halorubrum aethiopicum]
MRRISRRSTLRGIAAAGAAGIAGFGGCLGDPGTGADGGSDPDPETAVHQVGGALSGPAWRRTERPGFVTLFDERDAVEWLLRDAPPETVGFVDDTDFEESVLAYVESVGRNTCERLVEFADVAVDDDTLTATAEATAGDDAEGDVGCGQAITYAGAFLRVTADPLPASIRVEVTDGWGTSTELTGEDGVRDPAALDGFVRPDDDPPNVPPALSCPDDGFERHPAAYEGEVNWGSGGGGGGGSGLELRVVDPEDDGDSDDPNDALRFERGDAFRVEMTNVSARPVGVGNRSKYNLEAETEGGWTDVRGSDDGRFEYTDELVPVRPGETVEWSFAMDEAGIVAEHPNDDLRVCPDLRSGRYRFVLFGADDVAVAFDHVA